MAITESRVGMPEVRPSPGLPMPANKDLTLDPALRPRVRRPNGARFPFPIPNGWFIVARSDELLPGDTIPLFYFGRELVLFRTESGVPRLVDAYCAHLGANLAVGGKVDGEHIACPFHGWCYDGETGKCVDIPYTTAKRIPTQARVRSFPTLERNRMIWAWHHLEGGDPFYDVPDLPEFSGDDPEWSDIYCRDFVVNTCCQEMAENNHDFAHFVYVHGSPDIPWDTEVLVTDQPYKRTEAHGGTFVRESFGLGLGVLRTPGAFVFLSSTTPIDEESVHVRWAWSTPASLGPDAARNIGDSFLSGVSQDIPIWENKRYLARPVLAKEEKGILTHRAWSQQFYSDPSKAI